MASAEERLLSAARSGNLALFNEALGEHARVDATDGAGNTALHLAAEYAHFEIVERLLPCQGVDVNAIRPTDGETALHRAAAPRVDDEENALKIVQLLIDAGVNVKKQDKQRRTAAQVAKYDSVRDLLKQATLAVEMAADVADDDDDEEDEESAEE
ncbi:hypothetical protein RI367_005033 [Sorochytrium milnesiophthora]